MHLFFLEERKCVKIYTLKVLSPHSINDQHQTHPFFLNIVKDERWCISEAFSPLEVQEGGLYRRCPSVTGGAALCALVCFHGWDIKEAHTQSAQAEQSMFLQSVNNYSVQIMSMWESLKLSTLAKYLQTGDVTQRQVNTGRSSRKVKNLPLL